MTVGAELDFRLGLGYGRVDGGFGGFLFFFDGFEFGGGFHGRSAEIFGRVDERGDFVDEFWALSEVGGGRLENSVGNFALIFYYTIVWRAGVVVF